MLKEVKQLEKRDQYYLASMAAFMLPPILLSLSVVAGIWLRNDSLTFSLVGPPGQDVLRSLLFVLISPLLAGAISLHYLNKHETVHQVMRRLSLIIFTGCSIFLAVILTYILLERF